MDAAARVAPADDDDAPADGDGAEVRQGGREAARAPPPAAGGSIAQIARFWPESESSRPPRT